MNLPELAAVVTASYLIGAIPVGYVAARLMRGVDIRDQGSGMTGATNVLRLLGRWALLDVFAITVLVVGSRAIFLLEAKPLTGIYVYAAAVLVLMTATVLMDSLARNGR